MTTNIRPIALPAIIQATLRRMTGFRMFVRKRCHAVVQTFSIRFSSCELRNVQRPPGVRLSAHCLTSLGQETSPKRHGAASRSLRFSVCKLGLACLEQAVAAAPYRLDPIRLGARELGAQAVDQDVEVAGADAL